MSETKSKLTTTPLEVPAPVDVTAWRKSLILKSGIAVKSGKNALEQDRREIRESGGFISDNAPHEIVTLAAAVSRNAKVASRAAKEAAIALGILDVTKAYATIVGPDGKVFKSAKSFYTALFPAMSPKTIASYVNAAKTIYIPALSADLDTEKGKALKALSALEPGTALSACGALNDVESSETFAKAVNAHTDKGGKLSQFAVKTLAAESRKDTPQKANGGEKLSDRATERAKTETRAAAWKATALKCLIIDKSDGDVHIMIPEDRKAEFRSLWNSVTNEQAGEFMTVLGGIIF